jgi:hypothetical protein
MAQVYVCDECGTDLDEEEIEFADIDGDACICAFCNSEELPAENYDGRFED